MCHFGDESSEEIDDRWQLTNLAEGRSERPDRKSVDSSGEWDADDYEDEVGDGSELELANVYQTKVGSKVDQTYEDNIEVNHTKIDHSHQGRSYQRRTNEER